MAKAKTKTPNFDRYDYARQSTADYFVKKQGDSRLPDELRIEPVRENSKYKLAGVTEFLCSRQKLGITALKTGLQQVCYGRFFFSGDMLESGKKHLLAIAMSKDKNLLVVFVFRGFYKHFTRERLKFVNDFLNKTLL